MPECSIEGERGPFRCTGYDGSDVWAAIHKKVSDIPCDACREHAEKMISGVHDHVNVGLGKEPFDERNYLNTVEEIIQVHNEYCESTGRCKIR